MRSLIIALCRAMSIAQEFLMKILLFIGSIGMMIGGSSGTMNPFNMSIGLLGMLLIVVSIIGGLEIYKTSGVSNMILFLQQRKKQNNHLFFPLLINATSMFMALYGLYCCVVWLPPFLTLAMVIMTVLAPLIAKISLMESTHA